MRVMAGEGQIAVIGWWLRCAFLLAILDMRPLSCGSVSCLQENELGTSMGWQRSLSSFFCAVCHCLCSVYVQSLFIRGRSECIGSGLNR